MCQIMPLVWTLREMGTEHRKSQQQARKQMENWGKNLKGVSSRVETKQFCVKKYQESVLPVKYNFGVSVIYSGYSRCQSSPSLPVYLHKAEKHSQVPDGLGCRHPGCIDSCKAVVKKGGEQRRLTEFSLVKGI